ncbi:trehalase family glycosidase [Stenomitos frigidus]|nr:trehalase family glycosidase [Stenomitos frigidus]
MRRRKFIGYTSVGLGSAIFLPNGFAALGKKGIENISAQELPEKAQFIWHATENAGRNQYVNFRRKIKLSGTIKESIFNIFADTSYQLFINEVFVCQGPIRFDPRYPFFDYIDLKPYLKENAENVISIQANFFGCKTYKSINHIPGLICWGKIFTKKQAVDLSSNSQNWKAAIALERSRYTPQLSFALNPNDFYDQSKEEKWKQVAFNDQAWKPAVAIAKQKAWGSLAKRKIPMLRYEPVTINQSMPPIKVIPLIHQEDKYSFTIPFPDKLNDAVVYPERYYIAYYTYVFSEKEKIVRDISAFWGEMWLNGKEVKPYRHDTELKLSLEWHLQEGWNYLFGKVAPYADILDFYLGIPKTANLTLSANKNDVSDVLFRHTPNVSISAFTDFLEALPLPYPEGVQLPGGIEWLEVRQANRAENPAFESCWDVYGASFESFEIQKIQGKRFSITDYPSGFALLFDLEYIRLCYPILKASGTKGSYIDFVYCEYIDDDQRHLKPTFNYQSADRVKCTEDVIAYMPNQPRGVRYMLITFRGISESICIESFSLRKATYPVVKKGAFKCSDPLLNRIWEMCALTQATNMEDAYVDCVGRERGMYIRDTVIQYHNNLVLFGDQLLFQRCMELYGQSLDASGRFRAVYPNSGTYVIADFALNAVEGFWAQYENTGDQSLLENFWPEMLKNIAWFNNLSDARADYLLDADWLKKGGEVSSNDGFAGDSCVVDGYRDIAGINCEFSCTYVIALRCLSKAANVLGKPTEANAFKKRLEKVSQSIHALLWDAKKGCYSDNLEKRTHSAQANLFALRAGVVDAKQLESVKKHIAQTLRCIFVNGYDDKAGVYMSPSYAFYLFDGLYTAGLEETAENLMRQGWGFFLAKGYQTTPEDFHDSPYQSLCHAWSASPVYYLSKYILGVHYTKAPDFSEVLIKPQTKSVQQAEGKVPHPKGVVEVKWHREKAQIVFDYLKAPEGVKVVI